MTFPGKYVRSIIRFVAIGVILARQIFIHIPRLLLTPRQRAIGTPEISEPKAGGPALMKGTLEKLGPTYVKFGQFLSVRPDLLPQAYCNEFKKLQDSVPPFPFAQVKKELERELKGDYGKIFSEFDQTPMAAASIAQVHRARLRSGEEVAVKIQRPGIREEMASDIFIMLFFAKLLEWLVPALRKHQPVMLMHEFLRWTDRELYFRQEGKNASHFSYNFKDYPGVKIPKVFREYTTRRILVMEHIRGVNILQASEDGIDRKTAAHLIVDSMLKQIFIDGFFHGDPHAGNILLVDRNTIAYLDFGIVGYLSEDLRTWIFDILYGMSEGKVERVINSFLEMCNTREDEVDIAGYRRRMNEILSELRVYEAAGIPFSDMMKRFLYTSLDFGICIPHDFVLVTKALTTFEGTCLSLDPEIRIVEHLREFVRKNISRAPRFEDLWQELKAGPFEMERFRRLVLKHGGRMVSFLENPVVRIEGDGPGMMSGVRDRAGMNTAYGMMIAALIIFAALLSSENNLEKWLRSCVRLPDLPVLPLLALSIAGMLWLRLILRNRRKKTEKR